MIGLPLPELDSAQQSQPISNQRGEVPLMKISNHPVLVVAFAALSFLLIPRAAFAADTGADLYKAKCAMCHGADATGKPALKAPSLVSEEAKKKSDEEMTDMIANGGKEKKASHAFSQKGLSADQIKSLVAYIRSLQKK
jgi:mono/diheme cytochrome c family protein